MCFRYMHICIGRITDVCIVYSGMIQVNSRPIYFREVREKGNN